ncbi:MAG: polyprenyl synthetase family protein [Flavobacteriaceae bacterium]|nr:polyprenyl synthetase family protein [Flavobacteriaceae bacterium]
MQEVVKIRQPILEEMDRFEEKFKAAMASNVSLLNRITYYIASRKGKQMRPMFVFLVAKLLGEGKIEERTYRGASIIELIHTASLVHDDVVDRSERRRGFFSINALWKNKIAVLVGDYFFSKGLLLSLDHDDFDLLKIVSEAVREMSQGELLQLEKARRLDIDEPIYYDIIRQKTATLIAACCAMGAASVGSSKEDIERFHSFGEYAGMAFQIKDDLFDYGDDRIGKPTGIDIKEQKMTLPLIHVLNKVDKKQRNWLINSVKHHNTDKNRVKEVIQFVKDQGGLEYAERQMIHYKDAALELLSKYPDNEYKEALANLVTYVVDRKK